MKRILTSFAVMILLGLSSELRSQEEPPPRLAAARESVGREIGQKMPGWIRTSVTPMEGSTNVIIDHWELGAFVVKVSIGLYPSQEAAEENFEKGKKRLKDEEEVAKARGKPDFRLIKEQLTDLGQDGYAWEDAYESTATAFREDELVVYVSVVAPVRNKDENLSKEFAKHAAKALRSK